MPLTSSTRRLSVALFTAAAVVAAGVGTASAAAAPADEGWRVAATRLTHAGSALWRRADATGANDIWLAGVQNYDFEENVGTPVIEHWNGSSWRAYVFPVDDLSNVVGLDVVAPDDVWVTMLENLTKRIYHFDGTYWTRKATGGSGKRIGEIAAAPGHAWTLASDHSVATYNGSTWTSKKLIDAGTLDHVAARTSNDAWAYGNAVEAPPGSIPTSYKPLALHWNGSGWQRTSSPVKDCEFTDIAAVGPDDAWAQCTGYDETQQANFWDVLHWNGKAWTKAFGPFGGWSTAGLTANAAGEIWAGGAETLQHFDGEQWQSTSLPQPTDQQQVTAVTALDVAAIPGSTGAVAVGSASFEGGVEFPSQFDVVWRSGG